MRPGRCRLLDRDGGAGWRCITARCTHADPEVRGNAARIAGLVWHRGFDSWEQPHLWGLAVGPTGDVFCAGQFSWDIDFGNGVLTAQDEDIFVARLNGMFRPPSP